MSLGLGDDGRVTDRFKDFYAERVLWGTDGPFPRLLMSSKDYLELIRRLPERAPQGIAFTEEEVAAIVGGNAARILGL